MTDSLDKNWLDFQGKLRSRIASRTWLPLFQSEEAKRGEYGHLGYVHDYVGVRSLAVHLAKREQANFDFSSLAKFNGASVWEGLYYAPAVKSDGDGAAIGIDLAICQYFPDGEGRDLYPCQDLVLALGLKREGDVWVRPHEGYAEVVRLERAANGASVSLSIRPEFLRDYLAARKMALLTQTFRERRLVVQDPAPFGLKNGDVTEDEVEDGRREVRCNAIAEGGMQGGWAVFKVGRTDEWGDDEVPAMGPETNENTISESFESPGSPASLALLSGEFRREEWVEPGAASQRIAFDPVPDDLTFITGAAGERTPSKDLYSEDVGRWLWFSPTVINDLVQRRGFSMEWYTRDTAGIRCPDGHVVHVGLNSKDLVVAYAYDIARLDEWLQRIWAGFNIPADGGVGDELHASQVKAEPAVTQAPEAHISYARDAADRAFLARWGKRLFRHHDKLDEMLAACSRFKSMDEAGFLRLAKELARVTADDIDLGSLRAIKPDADPKLGSLKLLQAVLGDLSDADKAKRMLSVLVGVYDLRLSDAHPPSSAIEAAMDLAEVRRGQSWLRRGGDLIHNVVLALLQIARLVEPETSSKV